MWPLKRTLLVAILASGAAAAAAWTYFGRGPKTPNDLELQGSIDIRQVGLSFKIGGRLATMLVEEGDAVSAGQVVARLDESYFTDDLRRARASVDVQAAVVAGLVNGTRPEEIARARAELAVRAAAVDLANQSFDRQDELARRGVAAHQLHDAAAAGLKEAQAQLTSAQQTLRLAELGPRQEDISAARGQLEVYAAGLAESERRLADAALSAPSAGMVLTRIREPGSIVNAGELVYAISLSSPVWARAYVAEPDLGLIRLGQQASVLTDAGAQYQGQIGFISPVAEFTPKSVETRELRTSLVYRLRVIVANPTAVLKQGMPVTVVLGLEGKSNAP
jgi:HlyD family secretion protein